MPTDYEELFKRAGQTPSPGGLDLNALLQRSIAGNIAGAQEETGIRRRKDASDLLTAQLAQAAQELENRMQGYEFEQTRNFDESLVRDPRVQAILAETLKQSGFNLPAVPTSRRGLETVRGFGPSAVGYKDIAARILNNWASSDARFLGGAEPQEVSWARSVLGVPTVTSGTGTSAPAGGAPATGQNQPPVPYGLGRAALGSAATGVGAGVGARLFSKFAPKLAPKLASRFPVIGPLATGAVTGGATQQGYESLIDPLLLQAQRENPLTSLISLVTGGIGGKKIPFGNSPQGAVNLVNKADETLQSVGGAAKRFFSGGGPKGLPAPPQTGVPSTTIPQPSIAPSLGGPQAGDFVKRFKQFYGRNPTQQELEQFTRGFPPTAPKPGPKALPPAYQPGPSISAVEKYKPVEKQRSLYKPKVKGYEEHLQRYFGQ